jgi:hypothetical protein
MYNQSWNRMEIQKIFKSAGGSLSLGTTLLISPGIPWKFNLLENSEDVLVGGQSFFKTLVFLFFLQEHGIVVDVSIS